MEIKDWHPRLGLAKSAFPETKKLTKLIFITGRRRPLGINAIDGPLIWIRQ